MTKTSVAGIFDYTPNHPDNVEEEEEESQGRPISTEPRARRACAMSISLETERRELIVYLVLVRAAALISRRKYRES